jgi:glucose-1-phosphate thymidylyltransferase
MTSTAPEPVGVIPGGGSATRLAPLPCSKELLPVGFRQTSRGPRPKVIANYLVDGFRLAGARQVFWLIDRTKADIMQYFGSGADFGTRMAYVPSEVSPSVVHTVDAAYAFLRDRHVLFGFPDIIFEPALAPRKLWERLQQRGVDVVLGAVPAPPEQVADRVEIGAEGRALQIRVKPANCPWQNAWILAAWAPRFTSFLHTWLQALQASPASGGGVGAELYMGDALQAAIQAGLSIEVETFQDGSFIDAGTPAGLEAAVSRHGPSNSAAVGDGETSHTSHGSVPPRQRGYS